MAIKKLGEQEHSHDCLPYNFRELTLQELLSKFYCEMKNQEINITNDVYNEINLLKNDLNDNYPSDFIKGTSFLCVSDSSTTQYLLNNPKTINSFKRCGIQEVFLTITLEFKENEFTCNVSDDILLKAKNLLVSNGFITSLKVQDKGVNLVNENNVDSWFNGKLEKMKHLISLINPHQINVANENRLTNEIAYKEKWKTFINEIKKHKPNIITSLHTFSSDFYYGKCVIVEYVDLLGINYYPNCGYEKVPSKDTIKKYIYQPLNSNPTFDSIQELCEKYNKKFIISEWGSSSFEYQLSNPSTDFLENKVINPNVQCNYMSAFCELIPFIKYCVGGYLWSSNCWRSENTNNIEASWSWTDSEETIKAIEEVWRC